MTLGSGRQVISKSHEIAYGKFFDKKAVFISLEWLPFFINQRREGYDFDTLYEDGTARLRSMKIMDLFSAYDELPSFGIKSRAVVGKGGEKTLTM